MSSSVGMNERMGEGFTGERWGVGVHKGAQVL